jgi:hypothetical protein
MAMAPAPILMLKTYEDFQTSTPTYGIGSFSLTKMGIVSLKFN